MSKTLTASDRKSLIRLASSLPAGSPERRNVLSVVVAGAKAQKRFDRYVGKSRTLRDRIFKSYQQWDNHAHAYKGNPTTAKNAHAKLTKAFQEMVVLANDALRSGDFMVEGPFERDTTRAISRLIDAVREAKNLDIQNERNTSGPRRAQELAIEIDDAIVDMAVAAKHHADA